MIEVAIVKYFHINSAVTSDMKIWQALQNDFEGLFIFTYIVIIIIVVIVIIE